MEYEDVESKIWVPEKDGDSVEGLLLAKRKDVGVNKSMLYHLQTGEGIVGVWGSTVLDSRLQLVDVGMNLRITFKGKEKNSKNQDVKIFKVEKERRVVKV